MKKCPKTLSLVLMTSLALGSAGCSSEPAEEFQVFNSVGDCVRSNAYTQQDCQEMFAAAVAQTPRFASKADCEQQFGVGNCDAGSPLAQGQEALNSVAGAAQQTIAAGEQVLAGATNATQQMASVTNAPQQTGGSWMPLMAGYMMGRFMGGGSYMQGSQPLYKDPAKTGTGPSSYRTPTGDVVKPDASGKVANPGSSIRKGFASTAKPTVARTGSGSRGGFSGSGSAGS